MEDTDSSILRENYSFQEIVATLAVTLMIVKFMAYLVTKSTAILTDALESIVNVIAALVGLYALHLSSLPSDRDHPFGHGKAELLSSQIEGAMITFAGLVIILNAIGSLSDPQPVSQLDFGLVLILFTAIANYAVGYMGIRKGRRNRSIALIASGKHLCSDTLSSVGIIVGLTSMVVLQNMGYDVWWLDGGIALLFGFIIFFTGIKVLKDAMDGVMDRVDPEILQNVIATINMRRHSQWIDMHNLRVSKYGPRLHIDVHIVFPRYMTVEDQHKEVEELRKAICREYGHMVDLTVMADPCYDSICHICGMPDCRYRTKPCGEHIMWDMMTATDKDSSNRSDEYVPDDGQELSDS